MAEPSCSLLGHYNWPFRLSFSVAVHKRLEITERSVPTDFVLLERAPSKLTLSSAMVVMLPTELITAKRL